VRRLLGRLEDGSFRLEMDNGAVVRSPIRIDRAARRRPSISPAPARSCPTISTRPPSMVRAAALYVLRTLIDDPIPMNDGCLRPVS
jgi:5-oxoprolinase (ATP-hydrolysing)